MPDLIKIDSFCAFTVSMLLGDIFRVELNIGPTIRREWRKMFRIQLLILGLVICWFVTCIGLAYAIKSYTHNETPLYTKNYDSDDEHR